MTQSAGTVSWVALSDFRGNPRRGMVAVSAPVDGRALAISTGDAVFRPLKTAEAFARDLVREIVNEGLRTGDKLPSEAAMLEQFGVSRESLREGLRLLEVQGLISLRRGPGGGPIVGHIDPGSLGRTSTLFYHLAGGTYAELLESWVVTEAILADGPPAILTGRPCAAAMEPYSPHRRSMAKASKSLCWITPIFTRCGVARRQPGVGGDAADDRPDCDPPRARSRRPAPRPRDDRSRSPCHRQSGRCWCATEGGEAMGEHIEAMIEVFRDHLGAQLHEFIDWR